MLKARRSAASIAVPEPMKQSGSRALAGVHTPGDCCAPQIASDAAVAGRCTPFCARAGLRFAGNWSNVRTHPPVAQCIATNAGRAVCGCAAP